MASLTTLNLGRSAGPRLRKPWEVVDQEITPHLSMEMVFGDLRRLRRDGKYYQASCPIHQGGETDSFSVDPERLEWICFVGCGGGGPIQFLQKTQRLTWMESAQALAVMAGVDAGKLHVWGQHWTEKDFERHEQLERRSSLLRIFMAFARSLLMSAAGRSLRGYLQQHYALTDPMLEQLELGLYTTAADVFHYLKRTGQDLDELRSRGLFEPRWTGRVVAPWMDSSGRIVNLWSWDCGRATKEPGQPIGQPLFERDPLGAQQTPFMLRQALTEEKPDLILMDEPLYALLARAVGITDPFPIATWGRLTNEQVDLLDQVLRRNGSLTLLSSYNPERYGTQSDSTFQNLQLLEEASFPVYAVDSKRLTEDDQQHGSPEGFLRKHGEDAFRELVKQAEVMIVRERPPKKESLLPGLSRILGIGKPAPAVAAEASEGGRSQAPLIGLLLGAAEEIGQRIARGFLKALPMEYRPALPAGGENPALPQAPPLLADAPTEPPPPVFSVDRLEQQSYSTSVAKLSGWQALDSRGVRFRPGELVMLGGGASHGKTSFLVGLLVYWLYSTDETFVYYSFDESEVQIYHRLLSLLTAVAGEGWELQKIRNHLSNRSQRASDITLAEVEVLETARECLRGWENRLHIVFRPTWTLAEIESHLQSLPSSPPLGGVLIDPADALLRPSAAPLGGSLLPASRRLKGLAVQHSCPVVASVRPAERPLRELEPAAEAVLTPPTSPQAPWTAGGIEKTIRSQRPLVSDFPAGLDQEADLILGLVNYLAFYPVLFDGPLPESTPVEVGLLKNRSGEVGQWMRLIFERNYCLLQD